MDTDVVIAGGGPFGLMLAIELGRRNINVALFDAKSATAFNPQANATQARTMEYFRRIGLADTIRSLGLPADYPTDIAYFTRYADHELGRFQLPAARHANDMVRSNIGSWTAAEAPHRVSQKYVEPVLKAKAESYPCVQVHFGWRLCEFDQDAKGVSARFEQTGGPGEIQVNGAYLVGADGARSLVRKELGIGWEGEFGEKREFMGGRMYAVYLRCPDFYQQTGKQPAWMNWTFNADRRAFMAAVDGKGEFAFHTQLKADEDESRITDEAARELFHQACGAKLPCEILAHEGWTAGHSVVASQFISGRIAIGGDAAHLFTPTGGLGYNTAVEDGVNLGWKLAALVAGTGGPALLDSYEFERRKVAKRNTNYARQFADSVGNYTADSEIESDNASAQALRVAAGAYLVDHARREFNIPGVTFGIRYDGSPVIQPHCEPPPPDEANGYNPSCLPGGRPPHWWFDDGSSLFDKFGPDWTLLHFDPPGPWHERVLQAASRRGVMLECLSVNDPALALVYQQRPVLIRPDQMIGWQPQISDNPDNIFDRLLGF